MSAKRPTRAGNNSLITSEIAQDSQWMIRNRAPVDSGGKRAADNGTHRPTRDRRRRNPHFVQRLQSQDAQFHVRGRFQALQLPYRRSFAIRANYRPQRVLFCYCELLRANQYHAGKNPPAI